MTVLEVIAVEPGTVIRSHGDEAMTVLPGHPVWKGRTKVFMVREEALAALEMMQRAFGPEED